MFRVSMLIPFLLSLFAAVCLAPMASAQPAPAGWTFMVYLDGDNDLELAAINDFLEMASVGSDADVKILVLFDRHPWPPCVPPDPCGGFSDGYDDWSETRRGIVNYGDEPDSSWGTSIGEANMGDPQTLIDFVEWGMQNHPAARYAVTLWDHGNGWRDRDDDEGPLWKRVCDDATSGDSLYMPEVRAALAAIETDEQEIDLLAFDACLMGMTEVAYEIREHADVMVASELPIPVAGYPYHTILGDLLADPTMSTSELGSTIVDRYYASYGYSEVIAAINLAAISLVGSRADTLAQALRDHWNNDEGVCVARAYEVMTALDSAIFAEQHGAAWPGSHGLAVYFPGAASVIHPWYGSSYILFVQDTSWDEFLHDYYAGMEGSWVGDARSQSQQYHECAPPYWCNIDLYDFCEKLIANASGVIWVEFAYTGSEQGSFEEPYNTVTEAVAAASGGETICIKGGSSSETLIISKELKLWACGGPVTIGVQP